MKMAKKCLFWTQIVALMAVLGLSGCNFMGRNESMDNRNSTNQIGYENDTSPDKGNKMPGNMRSRLDGNSILQINSIMQGEKIKSHLNNHPHINVIDHNQRDKSHYLENQVTVKFTVHPQPDEMTKILRDIDGKLLKNHSTICIFRSNSKSAKELVNYFNQRKDVLYSEPNYILMQNSQPPNDQFYGDYQWNLPMIRTEEGWNISRGTENIEIAVIDTGVDLNHPDLVHSIAKGYNVIEDNDLPHDDNGHGTHVSGIIASETDNFEGVAGISWFNKIMPVKAMRAEGYGTSFDIARGIIWAVDNGADVINMSLGNYQPSEVLKEAIDYAYKKNVVLVAAAGNDSTNQPSYPAAFPEVLCVTAVDWNGNIAQFSNYGEHVDVAAPGVDIASTYLDKQYAALSGTSMASPHVAALAGLIRSINPKLKNTEVMDIIRRSTIDLGEEGKDQYYGNGLIDIAKALREAEYKK
jgi:thermitase